jgi:hypothetical protein
VLATISTVKCDCDDADVDITYRMCCITVGTSPSFKAATLFDTGANASYVNREVVARIEDQAGKGKQKGGRKRRWEAARSTSVSLAGTSMSSPVLGNVVFDLTFLNEVSKKHETIKDIHAQVLDSCIAIIVGRPIIRENHLVRKIPQYFDEIPSSKPDLSQPGEPVTTPVTSRAACRGMQSCNTCTPFVAQGYSDTLCSLSVLRTDHPHVPQERRRPHVEPFGTKLIPRNALLDAMDDDDDIEWPEDPFDRPHRAEPESPDELLAMIQFEGTSALQDALRALRREFIDIFSKVQSMVIEIDRTKWELPSNRLPQRHHSAEKQTASIAEAWRHRGIACKPLEPDSPGPKIPGKVATDPRLHEGWIATDPGMRRRGD